MSPIVNQTQAESPKSKTEVENNKQNSLKFVQGGSKFAISFFNTGLWVFGSGRFLVVSFILISVAAYGIAASFVTSLAIVGGIIACGVFLFLLSLMGVIGAARHSQVLLFFYMIILFLLFVVQFSLACACLAFNEDQQYKLAYEGWHQAPMDLRNETQLYFDCCGFQNASLPEGDPMQAPSCSSVHFCQESVENMKICEDSGDTCWMKLQKVINNALRITGGVGLFFSFTEFIGVWLTVRFRNQKDPRSNPHAFL